MTDLDEYELESVIEALRSEARDAARRVRHCLECDRGYIFRPLEVSTPGYNCAEVCDCLKDYKRVGRELHSKLHEYERRFKREYKDPIDSEMTYLAMPTKDPVSLERMAHWTRQLARLTKGFEIEEQP